MRRFQNIVLAVAAAILLYLGIPNLLGSIWMATGDPIYQDLGEGKTLTPEEIQTLIDSRETALALTGDPKAASDLGLVYIAAGTSPEAIEKAIKSTEASLAAKPVSAFIWLRLATLLTFVPERRDEAAEAWQTARALAEVEPLMLHDRIRVGISLYRNLSETDRKNLITDVETAYAGNRHQLRAYAQQNDLLEWIKFLLKDPEKTRYLSS